MNNRGFFEEEESYLDAIKRDTPSPSNFRAIASIVIGSLTLLLIWLKIILIFLALLFIVVNIAGIFLAVSARKANESAGHSTALATVGLVVNVISLAIYSVGFIACSACAACVVTLF